MREYEVAVILHPDLEIDLEAPLERLNELFERLGARVIKRDDWGKRKLAYPIDRQTFGVYVFYRIECEPDKTTELERNLGLMEEVVRHLLITYEAPVETEESSGEEVAADSKETAPAEATKEKE